ncbi:AAA family ATPase [Polaromonas sp.]|uniref:AAA family ATPase n=1 Tax=Polaromonas sp. TaxID=1869339 RepID=UPI002FC75CA9
MQLGQPEGIESRPFNAISTAHKVPEELLLAVCSLSSSKKYYDTLATLEKTLARDVLSSLRDAAYLPEVRQKFQSEQCFKVSLLRDSTARELLDSAGTRFGTQRQLIGQFSTKILLDGASAPHKFEFDFLPRGSVPRRIHSIVGLNGVGKTQVMARLAMLLSRFSNQATNDNRSTLQSEDALDPVPSIYTVVAVSFSAFDEFERPTQAQGEEFKYSYCGLQGDGGLLKSKEDLLNDIRTMISAEMPPEKRALLKSVLGNLVRVNDLDEFVDQPQLHASLYERLSAGQRLALNCICHILAKIGPRTLVLFDEPELHLHPQLLTGLLSSLAEILANQDSFAIVATHSPLVIQQLPKECVHVIRRDRMTPMVLQPTFQTFGESISEITRFVFASTESDRDYRAVLDNMFAAAGGDIDQVRQLFDGQLSLNADIYLESLRGHSKGEVAK